MKPGTPLPWDVAILGHPEPGGTDISAGRRLVANAGGYNDCQEDTRDINIANAAYIVHACNAYPDLLAALKDMTPPMPLSDARCHIGIVPQSECHYCQRVAAAHAAIAKAEGRTDGDEG